MQLFDFEALLLKNATFKIHGLKFNLVSFTENIDAFLASHQWLCQKKRVVFQH